MTRRTSVAKRPELTKLERESAAIKRRIANLHVEMHHQAPSQKQVPTHGLITTPKVSDHALIRYLERVHGLNLEPLRKKIMTEDVVRAIKSGDPYVYQGTFTLCINNSVISTVLTPDMMEP